MFGGGKLMTKTKEIFKVFFRNKPTLILIRLLDSESSNKEVYASKLAKSVDCTYSHVVKVLKEMEKAKLVSFDKQGRLKILTLTSKGRNVAKHMKKIEMILK